MNLRSIDLNLLVALDALLGEQHVTRAADRVGLSQPAMSNALSRLRHLFQDELLVRTATGMQATARALELAEPTRQVLRQIERVFESDRGSPATWRTFTTRLSDLLGLLLLPQLLEEPAARLHRPVRHRAHAASPYGRGPREGRDRRGRQHGAGALGPRSSPCRSCATAWCA